MHFHLHITVQPHHSWTHADLADALAQDVARHGVKPLVITNHFRDHRKSYKELVPSKIFECSNESDASAEIFKMGVLLNNRGWRVKRLKIGGDPRHAAIANRAIYYETHIKNSQYPLGYPRSTTFKGNEFYTIRAPRREVVRDWALDAHAPYCDGERENPCPRLYIEAAVLDTNPQLDHDWINQ